ncbi:hypothetical protein J6S39_00980 [Candidatus Saccharibacteria bacterium]|nr:hypothetical protein [Candidatus Saccharibacteria bacterium]
MNIDNLFEYLIVKYHWTEERTYPYDLLCLLYPGEVLSRNDRSDLEILAEEFDDRRLLIKEEWLEEEVQQEVRDLGEFNRKLDEAAAILVLIILVVIVLFNIAIMFLSPTADMKNRIVVVSIITYVLVLFSYLATRKSRINAKALKDKVVKDSTVIRYYEQHISMMEQCARETRRFIDEHTKKPECINNPEPKNDNQGG